MIRHLSLHKKTNWARKRAREREIGQEWKNSDVIHLSGTWLIHRSSQMLNSLLWFCKRVQLIYNLITFTLLILRFMCICACVCVNLGQVLSRMKCCSAFFSPSVSLCNKGIPAFVNISFNTSIFNAFVFSPEENVYFL